MNTYKITNITNLSGKRDFKHNSSLDINYIDNLTKKKITIKAGEFVYLTVNSLPMSVRKLRVENLITVVEVSNSEMVSLISNKTKPTNKPVQELPQTVIPKTKKNVRMVNKTEE
jgi:hypothetical protein